MNQNIEVIKQMLENDSFDKNTILNIMTSYKNDIAVVPLMFWGEQKILRTRKNEDDVFGFLHELSYPPIEFARTDRASLKGKPMFYASIFTKDFERTNALPRCVSALETSSLLKTKGKFGFEAITQSVWGINSPIHLFAFPFSNKYKHACEDVRIIKTETETMLRENYSSESIEFFTFLGDLMAEPNSSCLYEVTATCVDFILENFSYDGILYPSVPTDGQGLNICIKPNVVDKKVRFLGAVLETIVRRGDKSEIKILANSSMLNENSFRWVITDDGKEFMINLRLLEPESRDIDIIVSSQELMNKIK